MGNGLVVLPENPRKLRCSPFKQRYLNVTPSTSIRSFGMADRRALSCDDCFFRRAELCAIAGNTPCPTFRRAQAGGLDPPRQPTLVARPVQTAQRAYAAA
jgi:hypothetical protein